MRLPRVRGPVSAALLDTLTSAPEQRDDALAGLDVVAREVIGASEDLARDDDLQLTLFCLYELHYSGFDGVDDALEWEPGLIAVRTAIERAWEAQLRAAIPLPERPALEADAVAETLFALAAADDGPSLSRYVAKKATREQLDEYLIQRSISQLKEADPQTWAIPRLTGRAKAGLIEVQADEYGNGRLERMHSQLYARTMRGAGLIDEYGAYIDIVPAVSLASANLMSFFGLNRRLRGASAGHLAMFEMTSSIPNRMYGNGFRRHGFGEDVTWYFDEHVEADAVHEQIAARDLAGGLVESEPQLLDDVLFGAASVLVVDGWVGLHILDCWQNGRTSLRAPVATAA